MPGICQNRDSLTKPCDTTTKHFLLVIINKQYTTTISWFVSIMDSDLNILASLAAGALPNMEKYHICEYCPSEVVAFIDRNCTHRVTFEPQNILFGCRMCIDHHVQLWKERHLNNVHQNPAAFLNPHTPPRPPEMKTPNAPARLYWRPAPGAVRSPAELPR